VLLYLSFAVFVVLGVLAFRGVRWAYFTFVVLGVLFFPARVGFHFQPKPCECALNLQLALFSLGNYGHVILFTIFFLMTSVQARRYPARIQYLISLAAVWAFGIYVELAEGFTGKGHCRLRDLVPDTAGAVIGAILLLIWSKFRRARSQA
jgi:hypothetical protein